MNKIDVYDKFKDILNILKLEIKYKRFNEECWASSINTADYIYYRYSQFHINYFNEYHNYNDMSSLDLSFLIIENKTVIAAMPFFYLTDNNNENCRIIIVEPIFFFDINKKKISNIFKKINSFLKKISDKKEYIKVDFIIPPSNKKSISYFSYELLRIAKKVISNIELYINLDLEISHIDKLIRTSTMQRIKQANNEFKTILLKKNDRNKWDQFVKLHFDTSGHQTRSIESWNVQFENIENDNAALFYIENEKNEIISASFFDFTKNLANYSVSVSNRDYFNIPLNHLIIHDAIIYFKSKSLNHLRLGPLELNSDLSDKENNINEFKEGFATEFYLSHNLEIDYKNNG